MNNNSNEKRGSGEPVGFQVPELLGHDAVELALGSQTQQGPKPGLIEELGIDRDELRRYHLEQLADGGIELVN